MKRGYFCTQRQATLTPEPPARLLLEANARRGLVLFSGQPGNYEGKLDERVLLRKGARVRCCCPACHADLVGQREEHVAELGVRRSSGAEGCVAFSATDGEHATCFVTRERVRAYGENVTRYAGVNSFGAGRSHGAAD